MPLLDELEPSAWVSRLEFFLKTRRIKPALLAREASLSRQYVGRLRLGRVEPTRGMIARIVSALGRMTLSDVRPEDVFELKAEDRTNSLARRMVMAARAEHERNPRLSLEMLAVAEEIALEAAGEIDTNETLVEIWRARANALMVLGDNNGALAAIERAEEFLRDDCVQDFGFAFTKWARATVFFEMGRYAEALPLACEAAATLKHFGESGKEKQVRVLIGGIQYEQGDIDAAEHAFSSLLSRLHADDAATRARVLANLGCCRLAKDDLAQAAEYARQAAEIYSMLGLETEITRTKWAYGRAYLRRGQSETGIDALRKVAAEFRAQGLQLDAAEVELDIVEEYLRHGANRKAAAIAGNLVGIFVAAGAQIGVTKALVALRDSATAETATPDLVRRVRRALTLPDEDFRLAFR